MKYSQASGRSTAAAARLWVLKPQDLAVSLKLVALQGKQPSCAKLAFAPSGDAQHNRAETSSDSERDRQRPAASEAAATLSNWATSASPRFYCTILAVTKRLGLSW